MILILGDTHFGKGTRLLEDQLKLLDDLVEYCTDNSVQYLFLAGDVFDKPSPPKEVLSAVLSRFYSLVKGGTELHILLGNHDKPGFRPELHSLFVLESLSSEGIYIYSKPAQAAVRNINFILLPWLNKTEQEGHPSVQDMLVSGVPNIVIGHFIYEGCMVASGERLYEGEYYISQAELEGVDLCVAGHIHRPQSINNVIYPGSFGILTWGENKHLPHTFVTLLEKGDEILVEQVPIEDRVRIEIKSSVEDLEAALTVAVDPEAMYRVIIEDEIPRNRVSEVNTTAHEKLRDAFEVKLKYFVQEDRALRDFIEEAGEFDQNTDPSVLLRLYLQKVAGVDEDELEATLEVWTEITDGSL